jgi:nitroreductase
MCRNFLPQPVERAVLDRVLALAGRAPSAGNTQGWSFLVLEGAGTATFWQHEADSSWLAHPSHPGLVDAPVIVLPLACRSSYVERYSELDKANVGPARVEEWAVPYWMVDTAFATMLLLLGAAQEGLGALFFALRKPSPPLLAALGAPADREPLGAVALGWPSPEDRPSSSAYRPRKHLDEIVHRGHWGQR